ncbi:unnamed protein product [Pipistrellus nathusii]|uniref:Secreted protein n=1 Tax=Pipistrellus nathusii TaxID=59473 RepID=A0ABN9ZD51_PIPNA
MREAQYCFWLLCSALSLVLPFSRACSAAHRLHITTSIAFGRKRSFSCNFPAVKMLPCIEKGFRTGNLSKTQLISDSSAFLPSPAPLPSSHPPHSPAPPP